MANGRRIVTVEYLESEGLNHKQDYFADVAADATTGNRELSIKDANNNVVGQIIAQKEDSVLFKNVATPSEATDGANKGYADNNFANALKGRASGASIRLGDVSPIEHTLGVKVSGKNLFDKSIAFADYNIIGGGYNGLNYYVGKGTIVTISLTETPTTGKGYMYVRPTTISGGGAQYWLAHSTVEALCNKKQTITSQDGYISICITVDAYNAFKEQIQIELGSTATPYEPFISDLTAVNVTRCGGNLLDPSLYHNTSKFQGITYTTNGDTITLTGTAKASSYVNVFISNPDAVITLPSILQNKKIKLYAYGNSSTVELVIRKTTSTTVSANTNKSIDTTGATGFSVRCRFTSGTTYNDSITFMICTEDVENNPAYEPYKTPTEYAPAADGTVSGVKSLYPTTTLITDTEGVIIEAEYNRDINKAFAEMQQAILSLGGNV